MKKKSVYPRKPGRKRKHNYNKKLHLNTSFEEAIGVLVGSKKPTKQMLS